MEHRETYRHALLQRCYLYGYRMADREGVVKQVVVCVGIGSLNVVDECREGSGITLAEFLCEPLCEVTEGEEDGECPYCAEEVEEQVAHSRALGCDITAHRRHERGDGGAYI